MMKGVAKLAVVALSVVLAVGCNGGGGTANAGGNTGTPASRIACAMPAAGQVNAMALEVDLQFGELIRIPIEIDTLGRYWGDDTTSFNLGASLGMYEEKTEGSGWGVIDEFKGRPTGYAVDVNLYSLDTSDSLFGWQVGGAYMFNAGQARLSAGLSYGGLSDSSLDGSIFVPSAACDYYLTETLSIGLSWRYEHFEDTGSFSQNNFSLNVGYLFEMASPLLLKVTYGHNAYNNMDAYYRNVIVAADWVMGGDWLIGLTFDRDIDEDTWGAWLQEVDLRVGYRINDTASLGVGLGMLSTSSGSDSNMGISVKYSQAF
ncbi:MAG: hypothetical protein JW909_01635 [Planctomycetes bacterium]|nr:hypothetical protein [Planctomycetota bacterium]